MRRRLPAMRGMAQRPGSVLIWLYAVLAISLFARLIPSAHNVYVFGQVPFTYVVLNCGHHPFVPERQAPALAHGFVIDKAVEVHREPRRGNSNTQITEGGRSIFKIHGYVDRFYPWLDNVEWIRKQYIARIVQFWSISPNRGNRKFSPFPRYIRIRSTMVSDLNICNQNPRFGGGPLDFNSLALHLESRPLLFHHPAQLLSHQVGLKANNSQSFNSGINRASAEQDQKPVWDVCRPIQFMPWILGRLGIGALFLFGGGYFGIYSRRK